MNKKKKILFAAVDIGWRIDHYSRLIDEEFCDDLIAESYVKFYLPDGFYKNNYTYKYNFQNKAKWYGWMVSLWFFIRGLFVYDVFHFFSGETLLTRKLLKVEMRLYRFFGKRVVMHFVGSDIRSPEYLRWKTENIHPYLQGEIPARKTLPWQDRLIEISKRYADVILLSTPDLKEVLPVGNYMPVVLDLDRFLGELCQMDMPIKSKDEVVILHAPSNPALKGTKWILLALEKVAKESPYNVRIISTLEETTEYSKLYSVSKKDLNAYYLQADIVVDQLIIGWYGLQAVEALVADNQVVSYIESSFVEDLTPDCPIYNANVNTLERVVLECINRHFQGGVDFSKQLEWVKRNHSIQTIKNELRKSWLG